ncbi:MAG: hypothetical protein K1V83_02885 [Prevotella sp.]
MRKIYSFLLTVMTMFVAISANAQEGIESMSAVKNPAGKAAPDIQVPVFDTGAMPSLKIAGNTALKADLSLAAQSSRAKRAYTQKAPPTSTAQLSGEYVLSFNTLSTSSFDGGSSVTVEPDNEGDSITIKRFWAGHDVRAHVNTATGEVTIPRQYLYTDATLGRMFVGVINTDGTVNKTSQITGTVDADGNFDIPTWWAVWATEGTAADKFVGAYYNLKMERGNGTIQYTNANGTTRYAVRIEQTAANLLTVKNFFNAGLPVEFDLNRDRTATIRSQVALINTKGSWNTIKCLEFNEAGNLTKYSQTITTDKAAADNNTTITWSDWSLLTTGYYAGRMLTGTLTADNAFSYPELSVSEFEGEGTEANPYKISSLDHLILLADRVNQDDNYVGTYYNNTYTRTYIGKYFEITNDIDMGNYRFEAIGSTWRQRFAGVLDGKGHTIRGLNVNGSLDKYAGLFGICDTVSVLKNIVLEKPVITSDYYYAGSLVSWTLGDIENITVNSPEVTNTSRIVAAGVAGIVNRADNCHVTNGVISGAGYVGGVAGEVHGGIFNSSATNTTVYAYGKDYPSGGIVGNLFKSDGKNLYFTGMVRYDQYVEQILGGVAGNLSMGTLENSFFAGQVVGYSAESMVGGVVGRLFGNVKNCYSAGRIHCYSRKTGGIIGQVYKYSPDNDGNYIQSEVRNCYTSASVAAETYMYDKNECREVIGTIEPETTPVLENVYFNNQITNFYSTRFGVSTAELTSTTGPKGFDASVWVFTEGNYPRIKGLEETEAAKYSASAVIPDSKSSFKKLSSDARLTPLGNTKFYFVKDKKLYTNGHYASIIDNNSIKIGEEFGTDTLFVVNGSVQAYHTISIAPIPFEGDGTAESPYLIKTKADLIALSEATTTKGQTFPETFFEMTNDIDLEYDEKFIGINSSSTDAHNQFAGSFDGKGYAIHKMKLNCITWTTEPKNGEPGTLDTKGCKSYNGFMGRIATDGVLKNLTIAADADLTLYGTSAALVGYLYGRVENCKNYADVLGVSCWVGGIAGQALKESHIVNCYNAGNITSGYMQVGGITGTAYGTIENCVNTGDIRVELIATNYKKNLNRAGGITGSASGCIIKNCMNYGTVYAENDNAGGLSGALAATATTGVGKDDVFTSINVGTVYCGNSATIGAIGGLAGTKTCKDVYWDAQLIPLKANSNADAEGMTGVETDVLTSGTALENFDASLWDFTKGMYPALKQFANEEKVAAARKVILSIPNGNNAFDLHIDATLCNDAEWSLADGTVFSIEGNTLKSPATAETVLTDTLYAKNTAGVIKPILIKSLPANPLSGAGTEADPYIINNAEEWNALASYMSATMNDMTGMYIKVAADIDFNGKDISKLAADGTTVLNGTLDGDNHTVKGLALKMTANQAGAAIGTIGAEGMLKNITFEGTMTSAYTYAAGIVDKLYGSLDNVVNGINVTTTKAYAGGVAGYIYTGAKLNRVVNKGTISGSATYVAGLSPYAQAGVTYTDCGNEGKIVNTGTTAASYTAGLIGNSLASTFTRCYNRGEFEIKNNTTVGVVGGLVANAVGSKDAPDYIFTDCRNEADITASHKIAGFVAATPTSSTAAANARYTFTGCYNTGDISAISTKVVSSAPTAGIITSYTAGTSFTDCHNEGNILSEKNIYAAGIAGSYVNAGTADNPVVFSHCSNSGNIVADGNQGGGIVGYVTTHVYLDNCSNSGNIEGNQMVGGIASAFAGTSPKMINCYNTGNITAKAYRAGGLIAWGAPTNGVIENCWNSGNVASTSETDGTKATDACSIGGLAGANSGTFTNCYNTGKITGKSQVGGLVGTPTKAKTSFYNCYNAGKIVAPADTCGSIVGISTLNNGKVWTADNKVENTYYVDENTCTNDVEGLGTAISRKELATLDMGEGFVSVDNYSLPVIAAFEKNDTALFHAAELILSDGDTFDNVTSAFHVGIPDVVTWTSNCADIVFNGNTADFKTDVNADVIVKATVGELTKEYAIKVAYTASGISGIVNGKDIVKAVYYNAAGMLVEQPAAGDGRMYIVVVTRSDGSKETVKLINKK